MCCLGASGGPCDSQGTLARLEGLEREPVALTSPSPASTPSPITLITHKATAALGP